MDTSKSVFQLHGVNAAEQPILRRKLSRNEMVKFFEKIPPTTIALEACGGSHHWARLLGDLGHEVKLIAPQLAKPYVKRGKNDTADAEALCEAYPNLFYAEAGKAKVLTEGQKRKPSNHNCRGPFVALTVDNARAHCTRNAANGSSHRTGN